MKLRIKWAEIEVESEEEALEIIQEIEQVLSVNHFRWDYEIDEEKDEVTEEDQVGHIRPLGDFLEEPIESQEPKICSGCGQVNPPDSLKCDDCGVDI